MLFQVQSVNGEKTLVPVSGSMSTGNPVGTLITTYKKIRPKNYLYCDGRDTTGTDDELSTHYPALYMYLGSNVLPDYRECVMVGAEQNSTDTIATHDVYTQGQFKDDQMQKIEAAANSNSTYSGSIWSSGAFSGAFKGKSMGTQRYVSGSGGNGWQDLAFDSSLVTRTGTPDVTHGKQKAVYVYIKAVDGVDITDEDSFLNTVKNYVEEKVDDALDGGNSNISLQGQTYATNTYADDNPKIRFKNADASQNISLTFTDYDAVQGPASLTLNGNQGNEYFLAPNVKVTGKMYGRLNLSSTAGTENGDIWIV